MKLYGNKSVIAEIKGAIKAPFHIFCGPSGVGKAQVAMEVAKSWLCLENNTAGDTCQCRGCTLYRANTHPDLLVIKSENGKAIKIEDIVPIIHGVNMHPNVSENKVFIVEDAQNLTIEAQNKLLLTLEERPSFVKIIFIASGPIIGTASSRALVHKFHSLSYRKMENFLNIELKVDPEYFHLLMIASENCPGRAIGFLQNPEFLPLAEKIVQLILTGNVQELLLCTRLAKEKDKGSIFDVLKPQELSALSTILKRFILDVLDLYAGYPKGTCSTIKSLPDGLVLSDEKRKVLFSCLLDIDDFGCILKENRDKFMMFLVQLCSCFK